MSFPNCDSKYDSSPLITPQEHTEYREQEVGAERDDPPEAIILCYSRGLMEYLTETYDGEYRAGYYGDLYVFEHTQPSVGLLGNFGIGAPTVVMLMEELIADGVDIFLSIGFSGCLDRSISMGDFIICEKAIRDEGTSHHYLESAKYAFPSDSLTTTVERVLQRQNEPFHRGPSWTIDAIYRETKQEVEQYTDEGVLTVEMEAAAVFTVADHHDVEAAALFVTSDYLGSPEWEPKFHRSREHMLHLGETAVTILTTHMN